MNKYTPESPEDAPEEVPEEIVADWLQCTEDEWRELTDAKREEHVREFIYEMEMEKAACEAENRDFWNNDYE
jgi:hypothetical protein